MNSINPLSLTLSFLAGSVAAQAAGANDGAARPNVVLILADDVCYNDLELYGSKNTATPNLNRLASQGITFNHCYQQAPISSPTRHALYTGLYPVHSGAIPNHTFVYDDVKSFVQYFGASGYRTALYGKEHIAPKKVFAYDYLGDYQKGEMKFDVIEEMIAQESDKPLFLVVASHEAHGPYNCGNPEKWDPAAIDLPLYHVDTPALREQYCKYLAEIEVLDDQVGRISAMIERSGKADNTIFLFLSEQGNSFPFAKWTCYGQGLHSGMVVRYPGVIEAGSTTDALVEYIDVLPTLLDMTNVEHDIEALDGRSFADVLTGEAAEHKERVYGLLSSTGVNAGPQYYGVRTVANKQYRFILNLNNEVEYFNPAMSGASWKETLAKANGGDEFAQQYVQRYTQRPVYELYDVVNDPYEMHNLAYDEKYSGIVAEMKSRLEAWMSSQGDKGAATEAYAATRLQGFAVKKFEKRFGPIKR